MIKLSTALAALAWALLPAAPLHAQTYPDKPVRLIVPYAAGGNFDIIGRLLATKLSERWGKPVVVDNRTGANGNIGTEQLVRSAPDGYTLGLISNGTTAINPALYKNMPFDSLKDLTPITIVTSNPMVLVVNPSFPAKTAADLVAYAKANPGRLNLANGGNGTVSHLCTEMLKSRTGAQIVSVPYKGTSFAVTGVLSGEVQGMFDTISTSIPLIDAGKVRALAVTGPKRFPQRPELPTLIEMGIKDFAAEPKSGLMGPPGMPRELAERIQRDVKAIIEQPDVKQKLVSLGLEPLGTTPQEFAADLRAELKTWADVVKSSGAKME